MSDSNLNPIAEAFNAFPIIETRRLTLRQLTLNDAATILAMRSSMRINAHIARYAMDAIADAEMLINRTNELFTQKTGIGWAGTLKDSGQLIGTCGFNRLEFENHHAEIGGELSVEYWGKNLALEAVSAIIEFGFRRLQLRTIEAKVSPENRGAIFLMEQLGFVKEAHFKDRIFFNGLYKDMAVYTLHNSR